MTREFANSRFAAVLGHPPRAARALIFAAALFCASAILTGAASAQYAGQSLGYASVPQTSFPPADPVLSDGSDGSTYLLPERLRRTVMALDTREAPGTVIIDPGNTVLYFVLGQGRAIRYGVGVGREGFSWSGVQTVTRKAEWPDWYPTPEMIGRQPYLPRFLAGGPNNPLGARAMYLGSSEYRIHGTNDPSTIGKYVSSGCIRLTNEDVSDLFSRVDVGAKVVMLASNSPHPEAKRLEGSIAVPTAAQARPAVPTLPSNPKATKLSASTLY
jgi:lipoprotein-anchoring transpeptidase ErfK/SrfK